MKAMILAAGEGKRLRPLTLSTPKPLIPVGGIPLIHRTIGFLKKNGLTDIVINVHHLSEKIMQSVGDGSALGVKVAYSVEKTLLGTGGGIINARNLLGNDPFLVINSDIMIDINLPELMAFHSRKKVSATLVVRDMPALEGNGGVRIDDSGMVRDILGFVESTPALKPRLFTGLQVIEPVFFDFGELGKKLSSTGDIYPKMLKSGLKIAAFEHSGYFMDLGTDKGYSQALRDFADRVTGF